MGNVIVMNPCDPSVDKTFMFGPFKINKTSRLWEMQLVFT